MKTFITIAALILLTGNLNAQIIDDAKKQKIVELLKKYELYNQFTVDGNQINAEYTQNFIGLFDASGAQRHYNDLAAKKSEQTDFSSAIEYMQYAVKNYPYGIDVNLNTDQLKVIGKFKNKHQKGYIVEVNKKITGLYLIKTFHRYFAPTYFFITETVDSDKSVFLIASVLDKSNYKKYNGNQIISGAYIGLSGGYGSAGLLNSSINNSGIYTASNVQTKPFFNIEAYYMFTRGFGLGTGISFGSYSTINKIDAYSQESSFTQTDIDNDVYIPIFAINNFTEQITVSATEIPFLLKFRTGKGNTAVYLDFGVIYSLYSGSMVLNGSTSKKGRYPELANVIIDNVPEYGFEDNNYNNNNIDMTLSPSGLAAYTSIGVSIPLYQGLFLKIGANARYGITNVYDKTQHTVDYISLIQSPGKTSLLSAVGEVGISYNFKNLYKK